MPITSRFFAYCQAVQFRLPLVVLVACALIACSSSTGNDPVLTSSGGNSPATGPTLTGPTLTIAATKIVVEGNSGTSTAEVTVSLSSYTNPVNVKYATSDGTASAGSDYTATNGTLSFTGGSTTQKITVSIAGDGHLETDETFTITLSEPTNATLGTSATAIVTITNDDYPFNDTGLVRGGNFPSGNNSGCTSNFTAPQDCHQGRDATHNDPSDGHAGFSYTKLDNSGNSLAASATSWSCVKDNVTGLIWEVKTDDNRSTRYRWGGTGADSHVTERYPDWSTLVSRSNSQSLCGFNNWRVPQISELRSLLNLNKSSLTIDTNYFPKTMNTIYWSSTASATSLTHQGRLYQNAWYVNFSNGLSFYDSPSKGYPVRLVSKGQ